MNWKIIFQLSTSGLIIALASLAPLTEKSLLVFTLITFVICAWIIAKVCWNKYFFHGFLVSMINSILITFVHIIFWETYIDHHPDAYAFIPQAFVTHPRLAAIVTAPFSGALSGLCLGAFSFIASKIKRLNEKSKVAIAMTALIWFIFYGFGILLHSFDETPEQIALAKKAKMKMGECSALGDQPINRYKKVLIWDVENDLKYGDQGFVDASSQYTTGDEPVTVFLISATHSEQVGTYSVSGEPAYRDYVDVFVVQFKNKKDKGTAIGIHQVTSLSPRQSREVQNRPEHGDGTAPIADWISSLSMGISNTAHKASVSPLSDTLPAKSP